MHIITQSLCIIGSRTLFHNVCCEKSYGSDGGIHANCCIPDAQVNGEHRYVVICSLDSCENLISYKKRLLKQIPVLLIVLSFIILWYLDSTQGIMSYIIFICKVLFSIDLETCNQWRQSQSSLWKFFGDMLVKNSSYFSHSAWALEYCYINFYTWK